MRKTLLRTLIVVARDRRWSAAGAAEAIELRIGKIIIVARRRLLPDDAAEARERADQAARLRQVQDHRRHPSLAAAAGWCSNSTSTARSRPAGLPKCTQAEAGRDDHADGHAKLCPGAIVGTGLRHGRRRAARTARPIEASSPLTLFNGPTMHGNPVGPRPCPSRLSGADHLRGPDRDREDQQRPLRIQDRRRLPPDRQRLRLADLRAADDRPRMERTRARRSATPTPTAPTAVCRQRPSSASRTAASSRARSSGPARSASSPLDRRRYPVGTARCLGGDDAKVGSGHRARCSRLSAVLLAGVAGSGDGQGRDPGPARRRRLRAAAAAEAGLRADPLPGLRATSRPPTAPLPPALQHVKLDFDRDGLLTTAGLAVCPPSRIEGATPKQARQRCRSAIVGTGHVGAAVGLAGLAAGSTCARR